MLFCVLVGLLTKQSSRLGLPQWLSGKESAWNAGIVGLLPGSGRSPGGGHDNPLQYSCQENSMDRGAWWAMVHGVTKSWTQLKWLSRQHVIAKHLSLYFCCCCWPHHVACEILVPWPGIKPVPHAVEVQSFNHWTTREFTGLISYWTHLNFFLRIKT